MARKLMFRRDCPPCLVLGPETVRCPAMSAYAFGFGDPCLPTPVRVAPTGPMWWHEIKHDGYRLMVRQAPSGVRIRSRRGYDWTDRFPLIVEAASRLRATSFVLDGEGVILRSDGVSDFDALHDE